MTKTSERYAKRNSLNDYAAPFVCLMLLILLIMSYVHTAVIMERLEDMQKQYTKISRDYQLILTDVKNGRIH